jgi:hypothetical protein
MSLRCGIVPSIHIEEDRLQVPELQYGEAFERMGVPNMGRIGAPWCGLAPDGVMVFMAHQNHFRREGKTYYYVDDVASALPLAQSAKETDKRMSQYFDEGKRAIRLVVGRFDDDGDETRASSFGGALGFYYDAELEWIAPGGNQRSRVIARHDIPRPGVLR